MNPLSAIGVEEVPHIYQKVARVDVARDIPFSIGVYRVDHVVDLLVRG